MSFRELASIDINALTKAQLKNYVKIARQECDRPIDLRSANIHDLREYLQMYLGWKAESENAIVATAEPTAEAPELVAEKEEELCIESFNAVAKATIPLLLNNGTVHGNKLNTEWIREVLGDCQMRGISLDRVKEPLLRQDAIYLGLAGIPTDHLNTFRRIMTSPEEFDIPQETPGKPNFYQRIGSVFGADALCEIAIYHRIRANLRHLQSGLNISGLYSHSLAIRDKLFSCQDYDCQLELMPRDRIQLKNEVPRIVEYFLSLVGNYNLFRELDDESLEPLGDDIDLQAIALTAEYSWIHSESYQWERQPSGGYRGYTVHRLDPDEITLCLQTWDEDDRDFCSFFRVIGRHPDKSRFPYLTE